VLQKQVLTLYVMQKVNRLLYYRLQEFREQDWLAGLFKQVEENFAAFESGKSQAEIEKEID
jgi:hypothetical protein